MTYKYQEKNTVNNVKKNSAAFIEAISGLKRKRKVDRQRPIRLEGGGGWQNQEV